MSDLGDFMDGLEAARLREHEKLIAWNKKMGEPDHTLHAVGSFSREIGYWRVNGGIFQCPKGANGLYIVREGIFHDEDMIKLLHGLLAKPVRSK